MAFCGKCGSQVDDYAAVCPSCGNATGASAPSYQAQASYPPPSASYPPPPNYQQPQYGQQPIGYPSPETEVPRVKDYVVMWLLLMIPIANIVFLIIWAVGGSGTPLWKSNFARAYFIVIAIGFAAGIVLGILFSTVFAACLYSTLGNPSYW